MGDGSLVSRTDGHGKSFRARQAALNAVTSQKGFAFEFERQRDVQQVEPAAAEPFGVLFRKSPGNIKRAVHVDGTLEESSAGDEVAEHGKGGIAFAIDCRPC